MKSSGLNFIAAAVLAVAITGCNTGKPFIALGPARSPATTQAAATAPDTAGSDADQQATLARMRQMPATDPLAGPVATSDLGQVGNVPGVKRKPKPFIALPNTTAYFTAKPSTLLLEHAVADSPVPLSEFSKQPVHSLDSFDLRSSLSAAAVQKKMGLPAQLADNGDPWLVYRLDNYRELWLHFTGPAYNHLDAADVIRGAEDGYVRDRVFGQ